MGTKFSNPKTSSIPEYYSLTEIKNTISQLNAILQNCSSQLNLQIIFISSKLSFNDINWKKSLVPGNIKIYRKTYQGESIVLSVESIYEIYDQMKHLKSKDKTKMRQSRQLLVKSTPMGGSQKSPSYIDPDEGLQCCICLNSAPTCALPCSHTFCDNCTVKFIIEKQQKKCPQCRATFEGTNESFAKEVYTVIKQQNDVYEQVRQMLLSILSRDNKRIIENISLSLLSWDNQQKKQVQLKQK